MIDNILSFIFSMYFNKLETFNLSSLSIS